MNEQHVSDEQILSAIDRRLAAVEPQLPVPRAWRPATERNGTTMRPHVHARTSVSLGLGGLAVAAIAVVLAAVVLGPFGFRGGTGAVASPTPIATPTPTPARAGGGQWLVFRVVVPSGAEVSKADLNALDKPIADRLTAASLASIAIAGGGSPAEPTVSVDAGGRAELVRSLLEQQGVLQFVPLPRAVYGYVDTSGAGSVAGLKPVPVPGDDLGAALAAGTLSALIGPSGFEPSSIRVGTDQNQTPALDFRLTPAATAAFAAYTSSNVGDYFAIVLDGKVISAPYIQSAITDGAGQVSGGFTQEQARELAIVLRTGPLPYRLEYLRTESDASPSPR